MLRGVAVSLAVAGGLVSAGCSSSSTPGLSPPSPSAGGQDLATVELADMPTGTATLSWNPTTKRITASVEMHGFTPSSSHALHIHRGTCTNQTQPPSVPFPDVTADAGGAVKQSVLSAPVPGGIPRGTYLDIHLVPGPQLDAPTEVGFTPIACADIPADILPAVPVTLTLQPPQHGQIPKATATLAYHSTLHTLQVGLKASGLAPNSAHAAHIDSGSCLTQGAVIYPLPDLHADTTGDASVTITLNNVNSAPPASGWSLNVQMGSTSQIFYDNKPTFLFAPILCGDIRE